MTPYEEEAAMRLLDAIDAEPAAATGGGRVNDEFLDYQAAHLSPAEMESLRYWLTHEDEALHAIDAIQDARAVGDAQ